MIRTMHQYPSLVQSKYRASIEQVQSKYRAGIEQVILYPQQNELKMRHKLIPCLRLGAKNVSSCLYNSKSTVEILLSQITSQNIHCKDLQSLQFIIIFFSNQRDSLLPPYYLTITSLQYCSNTLMNTIYIISTFILINSTLTDQNEVNKMLIFSKMNT